MPILDPYHADPSRYDGRMPFRRVGKSGLVLPAVSLGLWHNFGDDVPFDRQRDILRRAFDLGVTHFDLANNYGPPYGAAEENFSRHLRQDFLPYREQLVISTKAGWDYWPGPYGDLAPASTCWTASTRRWHAWASTTSTSSITTAPTRTRLSRRRWVPLTTPYGQVARATSASPPTRHSAPARPSRSSGHLVHRS